LSRTADVSEVLAGKGGGVILERILLIEGPVRRV